MQLKRHLTGPSITSLIVIVTATFLVSCQQAQTPQAPPIKPAGIQVFVTFEGPWAIVPDPADKSGVLALAPVDTIHRPLAVVPADAELVAGVYQLTMPTSGAPPTVTLDPSFLQPAVTTANVQSALNNSSKRYAIRLPRPEAYLAETRFRSRVGPPPYPPTPPTSPEQDYVTAISLSYTVTSLTGFSLAGTPDSGPGFSPVPFQAESHAVRFEIVPGEHHPPDPCYLHARQAFHNLVGLLGLNLYIDYPKYTEECHNIDPQTHPSKTTQLFHGLPFPSVPDPSRPELSPAEESGIGGIFGSGARSVFPGIARRTLAYFFTSGGGGCKTPIIVNQGG